MPYDKTDWMTGDIIIEEKQDHMEQGIYDNSVSAEKLIASIAKGYNPPYNYGDYAMINGRLRMAEQDIPVGEAYTSEHWSDADIMGDIGKAVTYGPDGALTTDKAKQAQRNIGAVGTLWDMNYSEDQKEAARNNIGLGFIDGDPGWTATQTRNAEIVLNIANLAARYDPTESYTVGAVVSFETAYYRCSTATSGTDENPEDFDWDKWTWIPVNPQMVSYATQVLTIAQKAQARANIDAGIDTGISPEQFGAKGDGVTNDVQAIQYAFNEAALSGRPVAFRAGAIYAIGGTYPYLQKRIQLYGNGATIKALDDCKPNADAASCVLSIFSEEGQPPSLPGMGLIENLTLDCNGKTNIGLLVSRAQGFQIHGLDIRTPRVCGLHVDGNYEIFVNSVRVAGADVFRHLDGEGNPISYAPGWRTIYYDPNGEESIGTLYENTSGEWSDADISDSAVWTVLGQIDSASTVGVKVYNNDSHYTDIVTKNMGIGMQIGHPEGWGGGANIFNRVHSWNTDPSITPTSIMFDIRNAGDSTIITDCYCDTCAVAVKLHAAAAIEINGMYILHGGSGTGGHMTPEIMGDVVATVFDIPQASYAARIKATGMIYLSPTEEYRLFSIDAGGYAAEYPWTTMNDASIQEMENCPAPYMRVSGAKQIIGS